MKKIVKGRSPRLLTQYKLQPEAKYDGPNFTPKVKDEIKLQLLSEQGFLCAYCMRRISFIEMKVEHFKCQHKFSSLQLDYANLLGCCKGNEGNPPVNQTCDTRKGSQELSFSPTNGDVERLVSYTDAGVIYSTDNDFNTQINDVLNLNFTRLVQNRKAALLGLQKVLNSRRGTRTKAELTKFLTSYKSKNDKDEYREYLGLLSYYLEKRIRKTR